MSDIGRESVIVKEREQKRIVLIACLGWRIFRYLSTVNYRQTESYYSGVFLILVYTIYISVIER